jgi:hypothetical protein
LCLCLFIRRFEGGRLGWIGEAGESGLNKSEGRGIYVRLDFGIGVLGDEIRDLFFLCVFATSRQVLPRLLANSFLDPRRGEARRGEAHTHTRP